LQVTSRRINFIVDNNETSTTVDGLNFDSPVGNQRKERIEVPLDFCERNEGKLNIAKDGFVRDDHGKGITVRFLKIKNKFTF
jgi:hypothetical protein